jgi:hypothetical protein
MYREMGLGDHNGAADSLGSKLMKLLTKHRGAYFNSGVTHVGFNVFEAVNDVSVAAIEFSNKMSANRFHASKSFSARSWWVLNTSIFRSHPLFKESEAGTGKSRL